MKKTQVHQELSNEEIRLRSQLKLAQEHAESGDSRAQLEFTIILARLDVVVDEIEGVLEWIGQCTQEARLKSGY